LKNDGDNNDEFSNLKFLSHVMIKVTSSRGWVCILGINFLAKGIKSEAAKVHFTSFS